jgi:hypothetical protein
MPGRADDPLPHLRGRAGVRSSAPRQADGFQERPWFGVLHRSYLDFRRVRLLRHPRSSRVYPVSTAIGLWSLLLLSAQPRLSDGKPTRTAGPPGPRTGSGAAELRITRVYPCVACAVNARTSFRFTGCCWWRSSAVEGSSGASRGHGLGRVDGPHRPSAFQGGHVPPPVPRECPCGLAHSSPQPDRCPNSRRRTGSVKILFACTFTRHLQRKSLPCGHRGS